MSEQHKTKLANSQILNRLIKFCEGQLDMEPHRASACVAMARKIVPDLASIEHSGDVQTSYVVRMPEPVKDLAEWQQQQDGLSGDKPVTH